MADTVDVTITTAGWTNVSQSVTTGILTLVAGERAVVRLAAADPTAAVAVGHSISINEENNAWPWDGIGAGENVWVRAVSKDGALAVTRKG